MKITKRQLKQIIKEELEAAMSEDFEQLSDGGPFHVDLSDFVNLAQSGEKAALINGELPYVGSRGMGIDLILRLVEEEPVATLKTNEGPVKVMPIFMDGTWSSQCGGKPCPFKVLIQYGPSRPEAKEKSQQLAQHTFTLSRRGP